MDKIVKDALEEAENDAGRDVEGKTAPAGQGRGQNRERRQDTDGKPTDVDDTHGSTSHTTEEPTGGAEEDGSEEEVDARTTDEELEAVLKDLQTTITVFGCGGGGCNTINRMFQEGIEGARTVATNTDVQHLVDIEADEKILIGEQKTGDAVRVRCRRSARKPQSSRRTL